MVKIRRAMGSFAAAMVIAAAVPVASAQEVRRMSLADSTVEVFQSNETEDFTLSIGLQGRYSIPVGDMHVAGELPTYFQLFEAGLGVSGEVSLLLPVGRKWHIGPYLSLGYDSFPGDTVDENGVETNPERMRLRTILVGPRFLLQMGRGSQLDLHLALGVVHYSRLEGTVDTFMTAPQQGALFKASDKFAFDFGIRFNFLAGPVFFDVGFDIRSQAAPDGGDLPVDPQTMVLLGLEFGAGLSF